MFLKLGGGRCFVVCIQLGRCACVGYTVEIRLKVAVFVYSVQTALKDALCSVFKFVRRLMAIFFSFFFLLLYKLG